MSFKKFSYTAANFAVLGAGANSLHVSDPSIEYCRRNPVVDGVGPGTILLTGRQLGILQVFARPRVRGFQSNRVLPVFAGSVLVSQVSSRDTRQMVKQSVSDAAVCLTLFR